MQRTLVMALVLAVVSLAIGIFVVLQAFPTDDDIQRVSIEEISEDSPLLGQILESPLMQGLIDDLFGQTQDRVRDRVVDESRSALFLGAGVTIAVMVAGIGLIAADHRRRGGDAPTPAETATPAS